MADSTSPLLPGHTRIKPEDLKRLTIYKGALYWDGEKIEAKGSTSSKLVIALTLGLAVFGALKQIDEGREVFCKWTGLLCMNPPPQAVTNNGPQQGNLPAPAPAGQDLKTAPEPSAK